MHVDGGATNQFFLLPTQIRHESSKRAHDAREGRSIERVAHEPRRIFKIFVEDFAVL